VGEPLKATAAFMEEVRAVACQTNHRLTFSLSTRPILGRTESEAWDRARRILATITARQQGTVPTPQNDGSRRLLEAAADKEVHDSCLWMALALATGARGNSTALVGTPETVAEALVAYYALGPPASSSAAMTLSPTRWNTAGNSFPVSVLWWQTAMRPVGTTPLYEVDKIFQTPPDLVVKLQPVDIVGFIL